MSLTHRTLVKPVRHLNIFQTMMRQYPGDPPLPVFGSFAGALAPALSVIGSLAGASAGTLASVGSTGSLVEDASKIAAKFAPIMLCKLAGVGVGLGVGDGVGVGVGFGFPPPFPLSFPQAAKATLSRRLPPSRRKVFLFMGNAFLTVVRARQRRRHALSGASRESAC